MCGVGLGLQHINTTCPSTHQSVVGRLVQRHNAPEEGEDGGGPKALQQVATRHPTAATAAHCPRPLAPGAGCVWVGRRLARSAKSTRGVPYPAKTSSNPLPAAVAVASAPPLLLLLLLPLLPMTLRPAAAGGGGTGTNPNTPGAPSSRRERAAVRFISVSASLLFVFVVRGGLTDVSRNKVHQ
jgi:hypothetical protein